MRLVRTLISQNSEKHGHFSYYEVLIDKIEEHVQTQPDICIESCKSLIEGISKTILKALDAASTNESLNAKDVKELFRDALNALGRFNPKMEVDFVRRSVGVIQLLADIRNKRGDISHGKLAPKELSSYAQFSKLVMHMTEGIAFYMLTEFFEIDLSFTEEIIYDDNPEFNEWLDTNNPISGISFSRALFEQDEVSYTEQLLEYQTEQEEVLEETIFEVKPDIQ